jgi:hypothetical protein
MRYCCPQREKRVGVAACRRKKTERSPTPPSTATTGSTQRLTGDVLHTPTRHYADTPTRQYVSHYAHTPLRRHADTFLHMPIRFCPYRPRTRLPFSI